MSVSSASETVNSSSEEESDISEELVINETVCEHSQDQTFNWRQVINFMKRNEVLILLSIFFTIWSCVLQAYNCSRSTTLLRKASPPRRFFRRDSGVLDLFDGNQGEVLRLLSDAEVVFVMYYAPWCAECKHSRRAFEELSSVFGSQAKLVAVNCWNPSGVCRNSYKIYTYPLFIAYAGSPQGIYYTGPLEVDYMVKFLDSLVRRPFTVLRNESDVESFLSSTLNSAVLSYFDFTTSPNPPGFANFHMASMKALERDLTRDFARFGLILNADSAKKYGASESGSLVLYQRRNKSAIRYDGAMRSNEIVDWLFSSVEPVVHWRWLSSSRSRFFDLVSKIGPIALLITPKMNLIDVDTPTFNTFSSVAVEYFDYVAAKDVHVGQNDAQEEKASDIETSTVYNWTFVPKHVAGFLEEPMRWHQACLRVQEVLGETHRRKWEEDLYSEIYDSTFVGGEWNQSLCDAQSSLHQRLKCSRLCHELEWNGDVTFLKHVWSSRLEPHSSFGVGCDFRDSSLLSSYGRGRQQQKCGKIPALTWWYSKHRPVSLEKDVTLCSKLEIAKRLYNFEQLENELQRFTQQQQQGPNESDEFFKGLAFRVNSPLNFVALAAQQSYSLLSNLGLHKSANMDLSSSSTVLIILDRAEESQYVFDRPFTKSILKRFIADFTFGRLQRFRRSETPSPTPATLPIGVTTMSVVQLSSASFYEEVLAKNSQHVIVMYQSRWCGFCQALHPVFISLAHYFADMQSLKFAHIDVSRNELPWQFTVDTVPSVILYPAHNKKTGVPFPKYLPMTLPNLISFILSHTDETFRLSFALSRCNDLCMQRNSLRAFLRLEHYKMNVLRLNARLSAVYQLPNFNEAHNEALRRTFSQFWNEIAQYKLRMQLLTSLWLNDNR